MTKHAFVPSIQRGFVTIELVFALIAFSIVVTIGVNLASKWNDSQNYRVAAEQQQAVADAASKYLKDNFAAVAATAGPTTPAQISVAMLRNTGYLASGFSDTNAFGQTFLVLARKLATTQLEAIVLTTGGDVIDEIGTREIAENLGGSGGYIPGSDTTIVQGVRGGWQVSLANYGVNPGVGHTASALFLLDGSLANDYLYRNAVPGKPELNRMNTTLNMGGNDVTSAKGVTATGQVEGGTVKSDGRTEVGEYINIDSEEVEGTPCEKTGLITKNAKGLILSCQSGSKGLIWTATSGGNLGGAFMYSLNSDSCAAPNPLTGDCTCPPGFDTGGAKGEIISVGGSQTTYSPAQCTASKVNHGGYAINRRVEQFIVPKLPTVVTTTCQEGTANNCICPEGIPVPFTAITSVFTSNPNGGISNVNLELILYSCLTNT